MPRDLITSLTEQDILCLNVTKLLSKMNLVRLRRTNISICKQSLELVFILGIMFKTFLHRLLNVTSAGKNVRAKTCSYLSNDNLVERCKILLLSFSVSTRYLLPI